jgi:mRNA-degrading endonuclease RelE of RelBE toxin-antitoxin system
MVIAKIVYCPNEGEKYSPADLLKTLCNPSEQAHFSEKLTNLCTVNASDWNFRWLEHIDDLYQVRHGNFRLYFGIIDGVLVVCHICRKVGRKALPKDLRRARQNLQLY